MYIALIKIFIQFSCFEKKALLINLSLSMRIFSMEILFDGILILFLI